MLHHWLMWTLVSEGRLIFEFVTVGPRSKVAGNRCFPSYHYLHSTIVRWHIIIHWCALFRVRTTEFIIIFTCIKMKITCLKQFSLIFWFQHFGWSWQNALKPIIKVLNFLQKKRGTSSITLIKECIHISISSSNSHIMYQLACFLFTCIVRTVKQWWNSYGSH